MNYPVLSIEKHLDFLDVIEWKVGESMPRRSVLLVPEALEHDFIGDALEAIHKAYATDIFPNPKIFGTLRFL